MKTAAAVALTLMIGGAFIAAPSFGYDALRTPVLLLAAVVLMAAGSRPDVPGGEAPTRPARIVWIAALSFLGAHVASWFAAPDTWAAVIATFKVGLGVAVFAAVSRGWVGTAHVWPLLGAVAAAFGAMALVSRWLPSLQPWALGNTNYAGCLCAVLGVASAAGALSPGAPWRRGLCGAGAVLSLAGLWATDSRAGIVGAAAGAVALIVMMPGRGRWCVAGVLAVGAIAGGSRIASMFETSKGSAAWRLEVWKGTVDLAASHAVVGCGAGNFRAQYPPYRLESEARLAMATDRRFREAEDPHNTHLSIAAELGVPGTAAWLVLLGALAVAAWKRRDALAAAGLAGIAAFVAAGSFNTLREFTPFDALFWFFAALCLPTAERVPAERRRLVAGGAMAAGLAGVVIATMAAVAEFHHDSGMRTASPLERADRMSAAITAWPAHWLARVELAGAYLAIAGDVGNEGATFAAKAEQHLGRVLAQRPHLLPALVMSERALKMLERDADASKRRDRIREIAPWHPLR